MKNLIGTGCGLLVSLFCFTGFAQLFPPGVGAGGTNVNYNPGYTNPPPDYGTNLFLQMEPVSGSALGVSLHNSQPDVQFEILGKQTLVDTQWVSQGFVLGAEGATSTLASVSLQLTNSYFLEARSWMDSDGTGIPDWWQLQNFGYVGIDPYGDPDGDGWNNLQEYQNGTNPNSFNTPPAPQGVSVAYDSLNGTAQISWQPSSGAVTGYTVETPNGNYNVSAGTYNFTDTNLPTVDSSQLAFVGPSISGTYQVQADYADGDSTLSDAAPLEASPLGFDNLSFAVGIVAGAEGSAYLAASALPPGTVALRVTRYDDETHDLGLTPYETNFDIPVTTNGLYLIPASCYVTPSNADGIASTPMWWVQAVNTDGSLSAAASSTDFYGHNPYIGFYFNEDVHRDYWLVPPYFDGRAQLKQNLIFQLRAATADFPFQFKDQFGDQFAYPSGYAYSGFYQWNFPASGSEGFYDVFWPFNENALFRNFVFNTSDVDAGGRMTTGAGGGYYYDGGLTLDEPPAYQFQSPTTLGGTIPSLLATNDTRWLASYPLDSDDSYLGEIGVTNDSDTGLTTMYSGVQNLFGLPFLSAKIAYSGGTTILNAGDTTTADGYFYPETAQPQFETVEYDFWNTSFAASGSLPGNPSFATTNQGDLLIASVGGTSFQVAGYAKLAVLNGYSGVYGYLGQYFDTAYKITNGIVTTNTTGVLSPYGQFFATEPGLAALVTMPDIDTGERGTGVVYCVSLQVDKNNDGGMDLNFFGADATSAGSPDEVWLNNGHITPGGGGNLDQDAQVLAKTPPDYSYGQITCQRDLENFFRLWVCGMPSLPASEGYSVSMFWNTISGSPAINLYAAETNGGTGYLTDTNVAQGLVGETMLGTVSAGGGSFVFPDNFFDGSDKYLLFEGTNAGLGQLVISISQNGNYLGYATVFIDLHDIKDFYEQDVIQESMSGAKSNWTSSVEMVQPAIASGLGNDTNIIVLVHGINVRPWDCIDDAGTVFKRLYWAGFQGKFAEVEWPCNLLTPIPSPFSPAVFNDSELQAYKASTALTTCLNGLKTRFPNYRLNILAHSQGNAVVSEAIKNGAPFDTYIMTQGAMPDSAYDVNATNDPDLLGHAPSPESQPMGYLGIYTNLTGNIVNFYNPQDGVLDIWVKDQKLLKPSIYLDTSYYFYDGTNSYYDPFIGFNYLVTDPEESRAEVSRSLTLSIGQSGPASPHGVIKSAVDLNANFGFSDAISEHSAQWTRPIQTTSGYYLQILDSIKP